MPDFCMQVVVQVAVVCQLPPIQKRRHTLAYLQVKMVGGHRFGKGGSCSSSWVEKMGVGNESEYSVAVKVVTLFS